MGRGTGDEAAGTASALRILREEEIDLMTKISNLSDQGVRVFLDSRLENSKKSTWESLAVNEGLPCLEVFDRDSNFRQRLESSLSEGSLVVVHIKKRLDSDVEEFLAAIVAKKEATDFSGQAYKQDDRSILFVDDKNANYKTAPAWLGNEKAYLVDEIVFDLTTEELRLLSSGERLTLAKGEQVFYIKADDLSCSTRELAEGKDARVGHVILRYS